MSANLRNFAERYAAAWCGHDSGAVASFYSENGSLAVNGGPPAVGRRAIAEVAQSFMTAFPDMRVLFDRLVEEQSRTEFHWTLIGTNTGPAGKGNKVRISGFESWTIGGDGLIAHSEGHFDAADYERQVG
jgi:hypothetical protein